MKKWMMAATSAALLATLAGCKSSSSDDNDAPEVVTPDSITLNYLGRYSANIFGASAAEIPAFDPVNQRIFIVNAQKGAVDVLNAADPANPVLLQELTVESITEGAVVNSIAYKGGYLAVAVEAPTKTDNGWVALFDATSLEMLGYEQVGAQPDMVTFTPDGQYVLTANEGEPSTDYQIDPVGSISILGVSEGQLVEVRTAGFSAFNTQADTLRSAGVRIYGPNASVEQDLEPEYIAISSDSSTAWVSLQENNALAKVDIATATVTDILPLGYKDHGTAGNGLDVSDSDDAINIDTWPGVLGMYQPDSIAAYEVDGETLLVTANEGDSRAWGEDDQAYWDGDASKGFVEEFRVKHLVHVSGFDRRAGDDLPPQLRDLAAGALLNPTTFAYCGATAADPGDCRADENLGRLTVAWTDGYRKDANGDPVLFDASGNQNLAGDRLMYDNLYAYGARSFSIRDSEGQLVWDSGDQLEQYFASDACMLGANRTIPCSDYFNATHDEGDTFDNRSDNKGPEPEGVTVGQLGNKTFAFIGLERIGGVMAWDITDPTAPVLVDYLNTREDWTTEDPSTVLATAGDLGPEGLVFIAPEDSPNGEALLVIGNEVSGTTAVYQINQIVN
ncbi:choice-of-anchor I family protein [Halopseudomonas aestusnigri]|uniref:choice-of-anchor I family protein n=1 Tax=Halopseudomonas aestusnigri TaxID=857252 RepID=UPI001E620D58|nr:choice-of-anchor I family protein [Halopseudomonas aestusnigri]UGV31845.1 choice-of-anchor I family protein [Halopseudomonas aestusnigri]